MRSNYNRIGDHIELVDERNKDLAIDLLLGLSISKQFIPSVANTIGANMKNYKIIRKGQFACSVMQVRRDGKMPIALLENFDEAIISQAYPVFKVIDETKLLPEYLMMWFSRSEFDRQATFHAVGGVRGSLEWEDFLDFELPMPSIEKQQEIVNEYNTITNRIALNEQLNQKLEETAQALYKHWFVDFEFPNEEGKPYKSSDGKMVYNEELEKEIPENWEATTIAELCNCNVENLARNHEYNELMYLDTGNLTNNKIDEVQLLKIGKDVIPSRAKRLVKHNDIIYSTVRPNLRHFGIIKNPPSNMVVSTGFAVLSKKDSEIPMELIYQSLTSDDIIEELHSRAEMSVSTYPGIKPEDLLEIKLAIPAAINGFLEKGLSVLSKTYEFIFTSNNELRPLLVLKDLILSKMTKVELAKEIA